MNDTIITFIEFCSQPNVVCFCFTVLGACFAFVFTWIFSTISDFIINVLGKKQEKKRKGGDKEC